MKQSLLAVCAALAVTASSAQATGAPLGRRPCGQRVFFPGAQSGTGHLEVVGLTNDQRLVCFNEGTPAFARTIGTVSGLSGGDSRLVGIDFRPATGELWGLGNLGGLYRIDLASASAERRAQLSAALNGTQFDVDFNPTVDRLRIVSDAGQNLRANVDTGMTSEDLALNYPATTPATGISGAAYTNNDGSGDTATTLFDIDATLDQIVIQSPPNNGNLAVTGELLVDALDDIGFDIYSTVRGGRTTEVRGLAAFSSAGRARLFRINLLTGRASMVGTFNLKDQVTDIAIPLIQL
ncbi:MAG: DUF4394 domain-containing protein [Candidatus Binatia bacterium]